MGAAYLAVGVLVQLDEIEAHIVGVIEQQPADQRLTDAKDQLERFGRLERADGSRQDAEHTALRAGGHQTRRRWLGEQAAIAGTNPGVEHAHLPFEAVNRPVNVGFTGQHAQVIGQVAGGEVVGSIDDQIVWFGDLHGIRGGEWLVVDIHLDIGVQVEQAAAGRFDLQLANRGRAVDHLAL